MLSPKRVNNTGPSHWHALVAERQSEQYQAESDFSRLNLEPLLLWVGRSQMTSLATLSKRRIPNIPIGVNAREGLLVQYVIELSFPTLPVGGDIQYLNVLCQIHVQVLPQRWTFNDCYACPSPFPINRAEYEVLGYQFPPRYHYTIFWHWQQYVSYEKPVPFIICYSINPRYASVVSRCLSTTDKSCASACQPRRQTPIY